MSGENTTLKVTIIGDSKGAQNAMGSLEKKSTSLGDKLGKVGVGIAKGVGVVAAGGVIALGAAMVQGVKDAADYETLAKKTAAVLKSTGNVAGQSVKGIQDRAAALESMSGVDETMIINGQNVLATFTSIKDEVGKGNDIFTQATGTALDMSVALGSDLQGANIQLGKALNDPIKGVGALSKVGVSFTAQQKEQIKTLVKSGNTLGAQKIILKELGKEFGGAAKAAGSGFTGTMARVQDTVMDSFRSIGQMLLPVLVNLGNWFNNVAAPAIAGFVDGFKNGTGAGGRFKAILGQVFTTAKQVGGIIVNMTKWMLEHKGVVVGLVGAVTALVIITKVHAAVMRVQAAGGLLSMIKGTQLVTGLTKAWAAVQWLMNAALTANPIGLVVVAIALLAAGLVYAYQHSETFRRVVDEAFKGVGAIVQWLWEHWVRPFFKFFIGAIRILAEGWAIMLDLLGNVPGFGWAKDAAAKIRGASAAVDKFSNGLDNIDPYVPVNVVTTFSYKGYSASLQRHAEQTMAAHGHPGFATGGTNIPSGLAWVGERGPELMYVPGGSSIYNARESARMAAGGGGGSSTPDGGINVYVTVAGSVTAERDLAISIRNELVKIGKRNGGVIFPK